MNNTQAIDKAIGALQEARQLIEQVRIKQVYSPRLVKIMENECEELSLAEDTLENLKSTV